METRSKKRKMAIMKLKKFKEGLPRLCVRLRRLRLLEDLPNEILVKIFNFLPNHDVRLGISLACKKFNEICQDESLVPVKDLCINGPTVFGPLYSFKQHYDPRHTEAMSDKIVQSKNLTSLKVKEMNYKSVNELVSIALQNCPKLIHLEVVAG